MRRRSQSLRREQSANEVAFEPRIASPTFLDVCIDWFGATDTMQLRKISGLGFLPGRQPGRKPLSQQRAEYRRCEYKDQDDVKHTIVEKPFTVCTECFMCDQRRGKSSSHLRQRERPDC